ncbi:hypothetical protein ACFS07_32490 [Undibacterium arcticum]
MRSMKELGIPETEVKPSELELAIMLIEQSAQDTFDPAQYEDEEKEAYRGSDRPEKLLARK